MILILETFSDKNCKIHETRTPFPCIQSHHYSTCHCFFVLGIILSEGEEEFWVICQTSLINLYENIASLNNFCHWFQAFKEQTDIFLKICKKVLID